MNIPIANNEDYVEIQGGVPKISKRGKLTVVTHDYDEGGGMQVASHIDHGTVILETKKGARLFNVDWLKQFHGEPCEAQSRKVGGEGYPRIR